MSSPSTPPDAAPGEEQAPPPGGSTTGPPTAPPTAQPATPPRKSMYAQGSAANMIRSIVVIVALMALVWFMTPRVNSIGGPKVDVHATAVQTARDSGRTVTEAVGLPPEWRATSARYVKSASGLMTWHAGYQAPSGDYVAVEQTVDVTEEWVRAQSGRGVRTGELAAGGVTWAKFERRGKVQNSLLDLRSGKGETTTLLTGTADFDELATVAEHLRPVAP